MMPQPCRFGLMLLVSFVSLGSLCEASGMRGAATPSITPSIKSTTPLQDSVETVKQILVADAPQHERRQLQPLLELPSNSLDCSNELSLDVVCRPGHDCNFAARPLTCESKMFLYHGGSCRNSQSNSSLTNLRAASPSSSTSDSAADCQDFHKGPPTDMGEEVFVVLTDVYDTAKTASQFVKVGEYFWTSLQDIPTGQAGWSDTQNITFYRTNETTFDNMLQTMLFYAPCVDTPLLLLAQDSSVQLVALAIDTKIKAELDLTIVGTNSTSSSSNQQWQLVEASVALTVAPFYQGLPLSEDMRQFDSRSPLSIPLTVELNPQNNETETLSIFASATAITMDGTAHCTVNAVVAAPFV